MSSRALRKRLPREDNTPDSREWIGFAPRNSQQEETATHVINSAPNPLQYMGEGKIGMEREQGNNSDLI